MHGLLLSMAVGVMMVTPADQVSQEDTARQDSVNELEILMSGDSGGPAPPGPARRQPAINGRLEYLIDDEAKEQLGAALYENQLWTMQRNASIYAWQDFSTKVIFVAVHLLVLIGVYFAGVQFFRGYRAASESEGSEPVSEVELSMKGVKVSSPFLGVIILVISLAFFYLYLVYVYPISLTT